MCCVVVVFGEVDFDGIVGGYEGIVVEYEGFCFYVWMIVDVEDGIVGKMFEEFIGQYFLCVVVEVGFFGWLEDQV